MERIRILAVVAALGVATTVVGTEVPASAAAAKVNGTCTKVGQTATAGSQALVCTKSGSKTIWKVSVSAAPTTAAGVAATPTSAAPASKDAAWQDVIAKAKKEGKVTFYGSSDPVSMADLCSKFKSAYGIDCEVVRLADNDVQAKLTAERDTNKPTGDVVSDSALTLVNANAAAGWFTPVTGPEFDNPAFNKAEFLYKDGLGFVASAAVLTFGWNTQLYPKGLKDYTDVLDPALTGKIGVIDVTIAPSIVDFYLYLEDKFGPSFLARLANQRPRIYASSLPMGAALGSGEISAGIFVQSQGPAKAAGAPVDSGFSNTIWGARWYTSVLKNAPHPNAAQLFANYMITKEGDTAIAKNTAAIYPGLDGTLAVTADKAKVQDLSKLTPDFIKTYTERWKILFNS